MRITHPVKGYTGRVAVGSWSAHFLAGQAHDTGIPPAVHRSLEQAGFELVDDRPGRHEAPNTGEQPDTDDEDE